MRREKSHTGISDMAKVLPGLYTAPGHLHYKGGMYMNSKLKRIFASAAALAVAASTMPILASAEGNDTSTTNENANPKEWKFDFGSNAPSDSSWTQITASSVYTAEVGYGFLGQSPETLDLKAVVDGYNQSSNEKTTLLNGGSGTDVYSDYVYTEDVNMPIRFAVNVERNSYYKVKVTMGNSDKDSQIYLTSERRHFVLMDETITAGDTLTKEFTVAVHDVKWKDRAATDNNKEPIYEDDLLNICVYGENPIINAVEIQQIEKPKVVWVFGDSTVTDGATGVPYFGYNTYAGWGIAVAKYLPSDVAVVNLGEGGLNTSNTAYFDVGANDITEGDIVLFQMGHNDNSTESYTAGLDYYYNKTTEKKATFVLCSPIERLSNVTTEPYHEAALAYATSKGTPFISLHDATKAIYEEMGDIGKWYTHSCLWKGTPASPESERDATHLNDFGADMTTARLFTALEQLSSQYPVLADYVSDEEIEPIVPEEEIMKGGTNDYVMPPNDLYPLPEASIPYPNIVDITSANVVNIDGVNYLQSVNTVRHSDLSYITVFGVTYNADGTLASMAQKRLEPMSAKTPETVSFIDEDTPNGLIIPDGGSYKSFVWSGAFSDGSMSYTPLSSVKEATDYKNTGLETEWVGAIDDSKITGHSYSVLSTPVTSGKINIELNMTINSGNPEIILAEDVLGSGENGISLAVQSSTGAVSIPVEGLDEDGNPAIVETTVIDGLKAGESRKIALTYDLDYGILTINIDNVGIVDVEIPNSILFTGITPSQIGSFAINGSGIDVDITDLSISTLNTLPLPEQKLTINYDRSLGIVTAPQTAEKNSEVTIKAEPADVEGFNYVFGGWYTEDGEIFSKDSEYKFNLVDDLTLNALFYNQLGVEGVYDFEIAADEKMIKVPSEGTSQIRLNASNFTDQYGNPTAAFDTEENVSWSIENPMTGVSVENGVVTVASDCSLGKEEFANVVIIAECNNVSRSITIVVHNATNIVYFEDFEDGSVGAGVDKWTSAITDRCAPIYASDGNNMYLDMTAPNVSGNNGTTVTGKLIDNPIDGIVQIKMDIMSDKPDGSEANRESRLGFRDSSGNYAVVIRRNQVSGEYAINNVVVDPAPADTAWASLTAVLNYNTQTADIALTSLDGATVYYNDDDVPFYADATNFADVYFDTNRYTAASRLDNIIINNIASNDEIPSITGDKTEISISDISTPETVTFTLPEGWEISSAVIADDSIAQTSVSENIVTITALTEGDTVLNITFASKDNPYVSTLCTIPVSVKALDNANLRSLSVTTDTGSELIDGFDMNVTEYITKAETSAKTIIVAPTQDSELSTCRITYDSEPVESGTEIPIGNPGAHVLELAVTSSDETTTKTYTITIDNTYLVAENFNGITGNWGFDDGPGGAAVTDGVMQILTSYDTGGQYYITKTFDTSVSELSKVHIVFDWSSRIQAGIGRQSALALEDANGNMIFALYGIGNGNLGYTTTALGEYTNFSSFNQNWYTVDLVIDFDNLIINGTITPKNSETPAATITNAAIASGAGALGQIKGYDIYSLATMHIDNFSIISAE